MFYRTSWERTYETLKSKHGGEFWADMVRLLTGLISIKQMAELYKISGERIRQIRNITRSSIKE